MAKIATKLLIAFTFLLIFFGFFIYWQRSSIAALIAYQLLKSEGVYAVEVDIKSVNMAAIDINKVVLKMESHLFHTTIELNQLRCQLVFYDLLSPICAPLHIQNLSIRANNRDDQTPPSPELILAMHDHMKKIAAHPALSQKTQIEQLHLHIEPYGLQTLEMKGNLRIEAGQIYLYYQSLKFSFLPFEIAGHLHLLNEQTEMALKTEKSHIKTQWVIMQPSQRIHKQLHVSANGHLDLREYQAIHQKLNLRPIIESTGFVQLNGFELNMPMAFDSHVFKSTLFRLKTRMSVDGSLTLQDHALSKINVLSDLSVDYSAEQMTIRFAATETAMQYSDRLVNIHSSDEHTLSWNGDNHWHLNIQSPIHWQIQQKGLTQEGLTQEDRTLAKGMAENIIFYQGNQTHLQLTLFNEESSDLSLQSYSAPEHPSAQPSIALPPYRMAARIDEDSKKWLFDFSITKPNSDLSANITGLYHPENGTWKNQVKIESALSEIAPLLHLLEKKRLFSLPLSLTQQFSQAQLSYQGALTGTVKTLKEVGITDFFTPSFWAPIDWNFSHDVRLHNAQSHQPWLRWNQLHLEVTGQTTEVTGQTAEVTGQKPIEPETQRTNTQQTGRYLLELKQSHFLKSLTEARIQGDFSLDEYAAAPHFEHSQAIVELWQGTAKIDNFSWHPEKASQWTLELSQAQINELFKLQKTNRYTLHPDLAVGSLKLNASPHFQTMAIQAILTAKNHSDFTDKANHEHFSLPSAQFHFELDEKSWMKLTLVTQKEGSHAPLLLYSTPLQHSTPQHP